jgi:ABC-2 type transport system ATP-binding protein
LEVTMIEARGLTKRYGPTVAVDGLTFEVKPGRVTGFLGPNGAGKTTTMRLALGLDHANAGSILVNGRRYGDVRFPLHEVGALLDAKSVHEGRRAVDHLWSLAQSNGISKARVREVLEAVGLSSVARKRVGTFSLGMSQRLGIAAALLGDPPTLLFDEPVNGLDPEGIVWIRELFKHLAGQGRTVFVSSHLMSEMAITAEDLIVIGRGKLIAHGPIHELTSKTAGHVQVRSPQLDRLGALLGERGAKVEHQNDGSLAVRGLDAPAIGELAAEHQLVLHELTPEQASLEETFFELTNETVDYRAESAVATPGA